MKSIYKYIPYEKLILQSSLSAEQVLDRIAEQTEMDLSLKKRFLGRIKIKSDNTYEGSVTLNGFEISRIIFYRNSFLPVIKGEVRQQAFGSEIDLTLRLNLFVLIFGFIWMGIMTLVCVGVLFAALLAGKIEGMMLMPFGMWIFGLALFLGGFKAESIRSRKHLIKLLDAQEKEDYTTSIR